MAVVATRHVQQWVLLAPEGQVPDLHPLLPWVESQQALAPQSQGLPVQQL